MTISLYSFITILNFFLLKYIMLSKTLGMSGTGFMDKMKSKLTPSVIGIILFSLLLIGIGIYYYYKYIIPKLKPSYNAHVEGMSNNNAEIILFYADWCPHCKTAKPEWEQVKQETEGQQINGRTIIFTEVNCTKETPEVSEMVEKYKVEGYPTIKLIKDDQVIDFDAKPTTNTLTQFLNTAA